MSETLTLTERIRAYLSQLDSHKRNSEFAGLLREAVKEIEILDRDFNTLLDILGESQKKYDL